MQRRKMRKPLRPPRRSRKAKQVGARGGRARGPARGAFTASVLWTGYGSAGWGAASKRRSRAAREPSPPTPLRMGCPEGRPPLDGLWERGARRGRDVFPKAARGIHAGSGAAATGSPSILPERRRMTLSHREASAASCVTSASVAPRRAGRSNIMSMIARPVVSSNSLSARRRLTMTGVGRARGRAQRAAARRPRAARDSD